MWKFKRDNQRPYVSCATPSMFEIAYFMKLYKVRDWVTNRGRESEGERKGESTSMRVFEQVTEVE